MGIGFQRSYLDIQQFEVRISGGGWLRLGSWLRRGGGFGLLVGLGRGVSVGLAVGAAVGASAAGAPPQPARRAMARSAAISMWGRRRAAILPPIELN